MASALKISSKSANLDRDTVAGFGDEWSTFDYTSADRDELEQIFAQYFSIFPWHLVGTDAVGFDAGCGSGRWARLVAPRVARLHCVDASPKALAVAERNLSEAKNCEFHLASLDAIPLADASMDFGYSLGVLHHLPNPAHGMKACVRKLKPGAPFLVYLYYAMENRGLAFRTIGRCVDSLRHVGFLLPRRLRVLASDALAVSVYLP